MRLILLYLALSTSELYAVAGNCPTCVLYSDTPERIVESCSNSAYVIACKEGKKAIISTIPSVPTVSVDRATCLNGNWYGTSCSGSTYAFEEDPYINCEDATLPASCDCPFTDSGADLNLPAPSSTCINGLNQVLECDAPIAVRNGSGIQLYDSLTCTAGQWYGLNPGGSQSAPLPGPANVQCGTVAEPLFPSLLPGREVLHYVGTVNGLQRYQCKDNKVIKTKGPPRQVQSNIDYPYFIAHGKFLNCNESICNLESSVGYDTDGYRQTLGLLPTQELPKITEVSCRDYGMESCSIPWANNAWMHDGVARCDKGFYLSEVRYTDASNAVKILNGSTTHLSTATCEADGWSIAGTSVSEVQLTFFRCLGVPESAGSCGALNFTKRNVQFNTQTQTYHCWNMDAEELQIVDGFMVYTPRELQCVNGEWKMTGSDYDEVTVSAGARVTCQPANAPYFPDGSISIIYAGLPDGKSRWACTDSTVAVVLRSYADTTKLYPFHAAYLEEDAVFYSYVSSLGYPHSENEGKIIESVACEDMGPKHPACSDPWDFGGIRRGNRYECMKGYFLHHVTYLDNSGTVIQFTANATDTKFMQCNIDGWQLAGTSLSALRVISFNCEEGGPEAQYTLENGGCSDTGNWDKYKVQYDFLRKYYTCYDGETLAYTYNSVTTQGPGKKIYCNKNATGTFEWMWSLMDGTQAAKIPPSAKVTCL